MVSIVQKTVGERELRLESGRWAPQADGAVTVSYGETVVLSTAVMSDKIREGIDFFPLSVEFEEKTYAAGKIPGAFLRREGRPPDAATMAARLCDRPLRPLFPLGMANEVQIVNTVLSTDKINDADVLGIVGASAALTISRIPFDGPVGAVRVGYDGVQFVINPTRPFLEEHPGLDLVVVGTSSAIVMLEAGAAELPESTVIAAVEFGFKELQSLIQLQEELRVKCGVAKVAYVDRAISKEMVEAVAARSGMAIREAVYMSDKGDRDARLQEIDEQALVDLSESYSGSQISSAVSEIVKQQVRQAILRDGRRSDGRRVDELRPLSAEVSVLPRPHGTAVFSRGRTQCLTVITLGSTRDQQRIGLDNLGLEPPKRYLHHYNMPPFASGETLPMRGPRRREIGHGALAERALKPVLPSEEEFPYTIRAVSEILSSNGSTSMAATTASSLALMDAGVPIKRPVTGISIGLVSGDNGEQVLLTDIEGAEDHFGDMDFKVAGSEAGITAVQLDIKGKGLSLGLVREAFERARQARMQILEFMLQIIAKPRPDVSVHAPKLLSHQIDPGKIGQIIGPGGRIIRRIEEETAAELNIEEDGKVTITSQSLENAQRALQMIKDIVGEPEIGRKVMGKVVRIMDFGAFVEYAPGRDGLVHVSELAEERVERVEDMVAVGDEIMVMITEVDDLGRVNLSRKAVLQGDSWSPRPRRESSNEFRRDGPPGNRGGRDSRGPRRGGRDRD